MRVTVMGKDDPSRDAIVTRRPGSCSVTSKLVSIRRPRNPDVCSYLEPTVTGAGVVHRQERMLGIHRGLFSASSRYPKTSDGGRSTSTVTLTLITPAVR